MRGGGALLKLSLSTECADLLILLACFASYAGRRHRDDPRFSLQHEVAGPRPGRVHRERSRVSLRSSSPHAGGCGKPKGRTSLMWVKYSIVDDTLAVRRVQSPSHPCGVCGARQLKLGLSSRLPSLGLTSWTWPTDLMLGTCAAVTKGQVWWRPCEMILS